MTDRPGSWASGFDTRGVPAESLEKRWYDLSVAGREEVFLRTIGSEQRSMLSVKVAEGGTFPTLVMLFNFGVITHNTVQRILDVLAYYGETHGLVHAAEYNTPRSHEHSTGDNV